MDVSIDQGGCVETSRPTTHDNPTFVEEGVIHYCVPNIPGVVARTATHAYLNAAWPYIHAHCDRRRRRRRGERLRAGARGALSTRGKIVNRECLAALLERSLTDTCARLENTYQSADATPEEAVRAIQSGIASF